MEQALKNEKLFTKNFVLTSLSTFAIFTSFYFLLVTLPIYILQLGGTESEIGFIIGVFTISAVLSRVFIGQEINRRGRKNVLVDFVSERSAAMATFTAAFDSGIGIGSIVLGVVLELFGFRIMYLLSGLGVLTGLIWFIAANDKKGMV
jgi:predicted MFS family arabinose efflux permease